MKSSFLLLLCSVYFVLGDKKSSTGDHKKHVQHVDNTQPVSLVDTFQFKEIFNNDFGLVRGVRTVKVKAHQKTAQNITVKDLQDVEFQPFALIVDHPQIAPDDLLKATPNKTQFLNYFCYALFRWIRHNLKTNPTVQQALIQNFYQNFPFPTDLFITNQTLRAGKSFFLNLVDFNSFLIQLSVCVFFFRTPRRIMAIVDQICSLD